jgi:hypothetical protein
MTLAEIRAEFELARRALHAQLDAILDTESAAIELWAKTNWWNGQMDAPKYLERILAPGNLANWERDAAAEKAAAEYAAEVYSGLEPGHEMSFLELFPAPPLPPQELQLPPA